MYDNILNKPLQLKPNISNAARHLLEGLLQKERTKRLGCKDDFVSVSSRFFPRLSPHEQQRLMAFVSLPQDEIKNHIFFSPINWDDLNAKKITPPFNPNVVRSFREKERI